MSLENHCNLFQIWGEAELQAVQPDFEMLNLAMCRKYSCAVAQGSAGQDPVWLVAEIARPFLFDWALECLGESVVKQLRVLELAHLTRWLDAFELQIRALGPVSSSATQEASGGLQGLSLSIAGISQTDNAVVRLVDSTLYDALQLGASDIHLETQAHGLIVKYRLDGVLNSALQVDGLTMADQMISRIKVLAELDIGERRIPQDGRFKVNSVGREVDLRVSIMPCVYGEDAVIRLLDRNALVDGSQRLSLDTLGFDTNSLAALRKLAKAPHGMLLVTGPTGSGKTTTLYGLLSETQSDQEKTITIEDPVEYKLPGVLQIPVNEKKGLTFARGLRSILRHDPDKIMVGEIRDADTAQIAVQSALTGHLVYTSVHANNVFDVLGRFLHMGLDPYTFVSALNGVVAQRLLRVLCKHCAVSAKPQDLDPNVLETLSPNAEQLRGAHFKKPVGCAHCRGTGYKGRVAVAEVLMLTDALRDLIATRAPMHEIKTLAMKNGTVSLAHAALDLVLRGETTLEELSRVAFST